MNDRFSFARGGSDGEASFEPDYLEGMGANGTDRRQSRRGESLCARLVSTWLTSTLLISTLLISTLLISTLLISTLLTACGGAPRRGAFETPLVDPPSESGLVWLIRADGRNQTAWVSLEDGTSLSSQLIEGPLWSVGGALWQWTATPAEVPLWDEMPEEETPPPSSATGVGAVTRGVLHELVEGATLVMIPAPDLGPVRAIRHEVTLEASVGPYLFVIETIEHDAFGAHPTTDRRSHVWDLRAAAPAEILTERDRAALPRAEAARRLREEGADEAPPDDERLTETGREAGDRARSRDDDAAELEVVALHPRWDLERGLTVELQLATEACYACSDGAWSDYTRSVRLEAPALPDQLADHSEIPAWALAAARRYPNARLAGFSVVDQPGPAQTLDTLRR